LLLLDPLLLRSQLLLLLRGQLLGTHLLLKLLRPLLLLKNLKLLKKCFTFQEASIRFVSLILSSKFKYT
jgi:hypothetical protein